MSKQPLILAVETSSRAGSVAIALGEKILAETVFSGPAKHGADLFPAICDLLDRYKQKPQEIEHVYISIGPGSFTGLRIATTLAKMMHAALAVKIVTVDTLDVIAANVLPPAGLMEIERIAPILDAKRNQFFVAVYQSTCSGLKKILPDALMTSLQFIERFAVGDKPIWLLGDGLLYYQDKFKTPVSSVEDRNGVRIRFLDPKYWSPRASKVHEIGWQKAVAGQFADPFTLIPNYIRPPEVKESRPAATSCVVRRRGKRSGEDPA
jgi:tRNA threonylcarbamoyl adenosine modification protein YeaZ